MKEKISLEECCKDIPSEFADYMNYVRSLMFAEEPDYGYLRGLLL